MKVLAVRDGGGLDKIGVEDRPDPTPGPGEVLVDVAAVSLNYHDLLVANGGLKPADGRILMSDGAGTIAAVGDGVSGFSPGDRVMSVFFPGWQEGRVDGAKREGVPGDHVDGWAAEKVAVPASAVTPVPRGWTLEQASTLPCAALTAWRAVVVEGSIKPGDWVLVQGSGGVSIFALQFARAAGARVIATSSSDEKLARLREIGAEVTINYRDTPKWGRAAREATGGRGVDQVIEIGGPGTLRESIKAARVDGYICMIGVLTGVSGEVPTAAFFQSNLTMKGVTVGSRAHQLDMIAAIETNGINPVIDRTFPMTDLAGAFRHQEAGAHFGKIVCAW